MNDTPSDSPFPEDLQFRIAALPDPYRIVVERHYLQHRAISEIARELSLSEAAIKARLHRARNRLRRDGNIL